MYEALEVAGLLALVVAGFLLELWLGFAVLGGACLWVSWSHARVTRRAAQVERPQTQLARVA